MVSHSHGMLHQVLHYSLLLGPRFLFFFQAEDGIRDGTVTGVQTCALPISLDGVWNEQLRDEEAFMTASFNLAKAGVEMRSEERRVGKECRSRWSPYH